MKRPALIGVAFAVFALPAPVLAQGDGDAERAFARAARSFNACLAAASRVQQGSLGESCLAQEAAYRLSGVRLEVTRGLGADEAESKVAQDIAEGRRIFETAQASQLASAR